MQNGKIGKADDHKNVKYPIGVPILASWTVYLGKVTFLVKLKKERGVK
jgi:hypothetical protein